MRITFFALAVLLSCGWLVGCRSASSSYSADDKSPIIVEINGEEEHQSAFGRFVKARLSDLSQDLQNQADNDKRMSRLFDEFVQRQVILQEARKKGIEPTDDEIRATLESQYRQTKNEGAEQNSTTLESGERRIEIFNDLVISKYHEKAGLFNGINVTQQEIEEYYGKNSDRYQSQNGFYVREIRVQTEADAQKLYRQALAKPQDFAVLAKEHSDSPLAANGGLMLYEEAQQLPPVLAQAVTPLKVGSISRVVKSNYGFHIFKLEQRATPLPLDKVKKEIEDTLMSQKRQTVIDEYNKRAVTGAKIKVMRQNLGFNYTGGFGS